MVGCMEMAVAIRSKGGANNFLLQSWGIGAKVANDSMRSAAATLAEYASKGGQGDIEGSGDSAPDFAYGDLLTEDARYRVVYRLVNTVYIMAVASAAANVFSLMKLVDAMTRVATLASRGVEVTPEKLSRRYPEVYAAVQLVVSSNGSADVSSILTEADTSLASKLVVPAPVRRPHWPRRKTGTSTPDASFTPRPSISRRSAEDSQDAMAQVEFRLPAEALVPLPGSAPAPRPRPTAPAAAASSDPFDAFGSPPATAAAARDDFAELEAIGAPKAQAVAASDPFSNMFGSMDMSRAVQPGGTSGPTPLDLDLLLTGGPSGPTSGPSIGFTTPSQPQMSPQGDWAAFNTPTSSSMSTPAGAPWQGQSVGNKVHFTPPPKALRPPSEADLAAVANGESLQLLETWQGSFLGSKVVKAGVLGQVGSSGVLDHVDCSVGFRLQAPPAGARILSAGLRCALLNEAAAKRQPRTRSAFLADLGKLTTADEKEPLLKYRLPAVACPPPLVLQVTPVLPSETASQKKSLLFVVQYFVNPKLSGALRDVTITLQLPKPVGQPTKISPKASWMVNHRQLRWEVARLDAGAKGICRAAFTPEYANEASANAGVYGGGAATAAFDTTCIVHFYGPADQTLSGVAIESGTSVDDTKAGKCMWHGTATAKPVRL